MQTWLDFYIAGALDSVVGTPLEAHLQRHTDLDAMRLLSLGTVANASKPAEFGGDDDATLAFYGMVLAFCNDYTHPSVQGFLKDHPDFHGGANTFTPRGIKVSADLVETFSKAKPPATDAWLPALFEHTWYFDLPHSALMLTSNTEIRAIFTQPSPNARAAAAVAILCEPGTNQMTGRFAWMLQADGTATAVRGMAMSGVDGDYVRESATDLVELLLLYRQTAEQAETLPVPQVTPDQLAALKRKKAKAKQKTHSLFRLVELRPPRDRFGRRGVDEKGRRWTLDHRVAVRGHFRWHAHGPKHALRRLQWIEPHVRGPRDGPQRVDLEPLG